MILCACRRAQDGAEQRRCPARLHSPPGHAPHISTPLSLAKPYTPDSLLGIIRRTLHESPPPRVPKPVMAAESEAEGTSFFAPAAPTVPSGSAPRPASFPQNDEEEDVEDDTMETAVASPEPVLAGAAAMEAPVTRRPAFLASALAQSMRSHLKKSQESSVERVEAAPLPD